MSIVTTIPTPVAPATELFIELYLILGENNICSTEQHKGDLMAREVEGDLGDEDILVLSVIHSVRINDEVLTEMYEPKEFVKKFGE